MHAPDAERRIGYTRPVWLSRLRVSARIRTVLDDLVVQATAAEYTSPCRHLSRNATEGGVPSRSSDAGLLRHLRFLVTGRSCGLIA